MNWDNPLPSLKVKMVSKYIERLNEAAELLPTALNPIMTVVQLYYAEYLIHM